MAAYPSFTIGIGSKSETVNDHANDFSESGPMHSRLFHDDQYYKFALVHPDMTGSNFDSLLATYAADPKVVHTLSYRGVSYDVKFIKPPMIIQNLGNSRYLVRAELYGVKT